MSRGQTRARLLVASVGIITALAMTASAQAPGIGSAGQPAAEKRPEHTSWSPTILPLQVTDGVVPADTPSAIRAEFPRRLTGTTEELPESAPDTESSILQAAPTPDRQIESGPAIEAGRRGRTEPEPSSRPSLRAHPLLPDGAPLHAPRSASGRLARSDPELLARNDAALVSVLVKLDYDPVASYAGDLPGLAATSPEVSGRALAQNRRAVNAYLRHIERLDRRVRQAIQREIAGVRLGASFKLAYGGLALTLPANRAAALLDIDGVVAVQPDRLERPLTDASPAFVGAPAAWDQLGSSATAGEGVVVGILDTGIWPEHPSFSDPGLSHPGDSYACQFGGGTGMGDPFSCNNKLVGAYVFLNTYLSFFEPLDGEFCNPAGTACSARDADGHGTHTASTAAGRQLVQAELYGLDRGPVSGIAPGAHIIAYRVCLDAGCFQSDSVAAVNQAIADGVNVINFSISGGANPFVDAVELAFLDAYAAGISVNASAGNSGPGSGTVDHAGPWTITVGASTSDRHFLSTLELSATGGASLSLPGATVTDGVTSPAELVLAQDVPGYSDALCLTPLPADSAPGKAVACERGVIARVAKSKNVAPSGAAGMILYNPTAQGLNTDNHHVPTLHIDQPQSGAFLDFVAANSGVTASWSGGSPAQVTGDVMAGFSSRGPRGDFLKPDVTAPGVQILAGHTPVPVGEAAGKPGELFQAIAGTSMSSPHAAGVAALIKAAHPNWTPGQIKSALTTSALQGVAKEDGTTPATPFDRGAGSIRADRALNPTFTFDVPAAAYQASSGDAVNRVHLNLPSVYVDPLPGTIVTTRTVTNVSGVSQSVRLSAEAPAGARISFVPRSFTLAPGESRAVSIGIDASALADGTYFGQMTVSAEADGFHPAALPVAFRKTSATLAVEHSCTPLVTSPGQPVDCQVTLTNFAASSAAAELTVSGPPTRRVVISDVSAPAALVGSGLHWSGSVPASGAPLVTAIQPGGSPFGYVPLASLGVSPIAGMGNESIANFNTPAFLYGSESYSRIGFTSNGYAVVGGGTAQDVKPTPQVLPDPARPNNVLAPFWTDLNVTAGGAMRAALVTDGLTDWIVGDWENVPIAGNNAVRNSFQLWIEVGASEQISYAYGSIDGPHAVGLTVGAENRTGSSGVNLGLTPSAGAEYEILTSPSGTSLTFTYRATSHVAGSHVLTARLTSPTFASTAVERVTITVE